MGRYSITGSMVRLNEASQPIKSANRVLVPNVIIQPTNQQLDSGTRHLLAETPQPGPASLVNFFLRRCSCLVLGAHLFKTGVLGYSILDTVLTIIA